MLLWASKFAMAKMSVPSKWVNNYGGNIYFAGDGTLGAHISACGLLY